MKYAFILFIISICIKPNYQHGRLEYYGSIYKVYSKQDCVISSFNYNDEFNKVIDFIKSHEGLALYPYKDNNGYSVGYGCRMEFIKTKLKFPITELQADSLLKAKYHENLNYVDIYCPNLEKYKRLAIAHLCYCWGIGIVKNSNVLRNNQLNKYILYNYHKNYRNHRLYKKCRQFEYELFNKEVKEILIVKYKKNGNIKKDF